MKTLKWLTLIFSVYGAIVNGMQQQWETAVWAATLAVWVFVSLVGDD